MQFNVRKLKKTALRSCLFTEDKNSVNSLTSRCLSCVPTNQLDSSFHCWSGPPRPSFSVLCCEKPCVAVSCMPHKLLLTATCFALHFMSLVCKLCWGFVNMFEVKLNPSPLTTTKNNHREKAFHKVSALCNHHRKAKICVCVRERKQARGENIVKQMSACSAVQYEEACWLCGQYVLMALYEKTPTLSYSMEL